MRPSVGDELRSEGALPMARRPSIAALVVVAVMVVVTIAVILAAQVGG